MKEILARSASALFRKRLKELGARRIWRGKAWYWEIKPDIKWGEKFEL